MLDGFMSSIFCVKNSLKINLSCRFVVEMLDRRVEIEKQDKEGVLGRGGPE